MPQKRYTADQIIPMLRRADIELGQGKKFPAARKAPLRCLARARSSPNTIKRAKMAPFQSTVTEPAKGMGRRERREDRFLKRESNDWFLRKLQQ